MNQKIRDLIEQARVQDRGYFIYQWGGANGHQSVEQAVDLERLVNLVIQKCIEEAGDPADGLILDDTWHDGVRASIWSIQQYFFGLTK